MMARAMVVAVLLMQCCNVILAVRPLLDVGGDSGRWLGQDPAKSLIMQVLRGPCNPNNGNNPNHPPCPPAHK